jgi:RNA recognition motif-containing protein
MTVDELTDLLGQYGIIEECIIKKNFLDNLGFVTFRDCKSSKYLLEKN